MLKIDYAEIWNGLDFSGMRVAGPFTVHQNHILTVTGPSIGGIHGPYRQVNSMITVSRATSDSHLVGANSNIPGPCPAIVRFEVLLQMLLFPRTDR